MNESQIESLLQKAPPVRTPPGLQGRLLRDIALPRKASGAETGLRLLPTWRRWFPALAFGLLFLACLIVLGLQTNQLFEIRKQNEALRVATADLEQLRQANDEAQRLRATSAGAARTQRESEELQKLQEEVSRLRPLTQELSTLRAEQQRLASARQAAGAAAGAVEDDPLAAQKARAEAVQCINNLKQIGLAARMWAHDQNTNSLPTDVRIMQNELNTPRILTCPSDSSRPRSMNWGEFNAASVSYLFPSRDPSELEPNTVYTRCPLHGHLGLSDGSVLNGNTAPEPYVENGQMKVLRKARIR